MTKQRNQPSPKARKPVSKLSDQELLNATEVLRDDADEDVLLVDKAADVGAFLSHFRVKDGRHTVGVRLLYRLYKTWTTTPALLGSFRAELKNYFKVDEDDHVRISLKALAVTKATYDYLVEQENARPLTEDDQELVAGFVDHYKLEPGVWWTEGRLMFRAAQLYARMVLWKPFGLRLSYDKFVRCMKLYFPYKYTNQHMFRLGYVSRHSVRDEASRYLSIYGRQQVKNQESYDQRKKKKPKV